MLTLNPDYFLLSRPLARFIYRLARKAAGDTTAFYSLKTGHRSAGKAKRV
ncbi:replication initiator protein A [Rhizobium mongolense]|nr:replication initiator protein A [Rhizobium sp. CC1099]WFU90766.1 replication initiator protein A [Rhizobium sp. CC1099]